MIGQSVIHLGCLIYAVNLATETMGPDALKAVVEFHKKARAGELEEQEDEDPWVAMTMLWSKPFLPNLMNTVVFLVETSQIMAVLLVNYKGRPWMLGVIENHALCLSLFLSVAGLWACAWGISPTMNELIHLAPFPDDEFRWTVVALVGISIVGTFIWDRLITYLFAPKIFNAMLDEAKKTTVTDLAPVVGSLFKVIAGMTIFATGNILLWAGIGYIYWKRRQ